MGDDDAAVVRRAQFVHALGHDAHCINIESRIGFVENREFRFEHRHLENLVALLLATAEALVHATAREFRVEFHDLPFFVHQFQEIRRLQFGQTLVFPLLVDGRFQKIRHRHARNLHGILEREENALVGACVGRHFEQILAVEPRFALGHFVERIAHEHGGERRFSRAIRPHNRVGFAGLHRQVDALQYFLVADFGV